MDWIRRKNCHAIRLRGRWAVGRALEHYTQESMCYLEDDAIAGTPHRAEDAVNRAARAVVQQVPQG